MPQKNKALTLPKLPYGEGSMSLMPDQETIIYKKTMNGKRVSVYGNTVQDVLSKMKRKEKEFKKESEKSRDAKNKTETLKVAINRWLYTYKRSELKSRSLDRLETTIKNQIIKYPIAYRELTSVDSDTIQEHINELIDYGYSYSVVKKAYEALNDFFAHTYIKTPHINPMLATKKPTKSSMNVQEKEVGFYDDNEIKDIVKEATRVTLKGNPVYKYGWGFVAILYTGIRISEALTLRWRDISFATHMISIKENISKIVDRSATNETGKVGYKYIHTVPKTKYGVRTFRMTKMAETAFMEMEKTQNPASKDEFVFATKSGRPASYDNMRRMQTSIQERASVEYKGGSLHVLRHTFCSLLVRNGVDKIVIASILGQGSTDMIEKIYQHVTPDEQTAAVLSIEDIDL